MVVTTVTSIIHKSPIIMLITINIIVSTCHYHRCRNQKPIRNKNTMHDFAVVHIGSILSGDKLSVIWGVSSFPYQHGHNWGECTHLGGWIRHVQTHLNISVVQYPPDPLYPSISFYIQNNCGLGMVKPPFSPLIFHWIGHTWSSKHQIIRSTAHAIRRGHAADGL